MKEYIKFFMRDKRLDVTLPIDQAERVIDNPQSLVKVTENGKWTGRTINKAEVIGTEHDFEYERYEQQKSMEGKMIAAPVEKQVDPQVLRKMMNKIKTKWTN